MELWTNMENARATKIVENPKKATQVTQVNAAKLVPYWKASAQVIATPARKPPCEYACVYCQQPNSVCCEDGKEYPCIGGQHDEQNEKEHDASCQKC